MRNRRFIGGSEEQSHALALLQRQCVCKEFLRTDKGSTGSSKFAVLGHSPFLHRLSPHHPFSEVSNRNPGKRALSSAETVNCELELRVYSTLSASTGLMAAARLAGK